MLMKMKISIQAFLQALFNVSFGQNFRFVKSPEYVNDLGLIMALHVLNSFKFESLNFKEKSQKKKIK